MTFTEAQVETLAALLHERFRSQVPDGSALDVEYASLPEHLRAANRASVRAIPGHLEALGYLLVAAGAAEPTIDRLEDADVERVARREHERWNAQTIERGYEYGPVRDDVARTHPDLVAWDELDEPARDKDRALIRAIPDLVGRLGLVIVATDA